MKVLRKLLIIALFGTVLSGFGDPLLSVAGIKASVPVYAQGGNNQDVENAGANIRASVIQLIKIMYDKLRFPVSLLMMVIAIGVALVYRRQGVPFIIAIAGFTFLWAFAPVIVKLLQGLAGGGGPIQVD